MIVQRYSSTPLSGAGAARAGGRFNRPGLEALYVSLEVLTAVAEYQLAVPLIGLARRASTNAACITTKPCCGFHQRGWSRLEFLGSHAMAMARASAQPPDRHGWVRCTIPVEAPDFSARELLRLGDEAEVLEPPALRAALQRLLRALARRYRLRSAPRRTRNSA